MSTTLDANVLLHAANLGSPHHDANLVLLQRLAAGPELLYVFWPTVIAFLRISTHPSIFDSPLAPAVARNAVDDLVDRPHVRTPGEQPNFWQALHGLLSTEPIRGNLVSDVHIAALMRQHGVNTIWTSDRDFNRFDGIRRLDPDENH